MTAVPAALRHLLPTDDLRARQVLDDIVARCVDNHEPVSHVADRHRLDPGMVRCVARGWHRHLGWVTAP